MTADLLLAGILAWCAVMCALAALCLAASVLLPVARWLFRQ